MQGQMWLGRMERREPSCGRVGDALRDVDFAVFFGEANERGVGEFEDKAEGGGIGGGVKAVGGEGFGAGVDDELVGDGVANDGGDDGGGAIFEGAVAAGEGVAIVEDVGAGTDFGEGGHQMGLKVGGG